MSLAAKRIVSGKLINAGQTSVAPDYIMVKKGFEDSLINEMRKAIKDFFAGDWSDFPHIINEKHFDRISGLMCMQNIVCGGLTDKKSLFIEPSILKEPSPDSPVMQEEIFGPLIPVLTYESNDELMEFIRKRPKPLALYLFTKDKSFEKQILTYLPYGGGCVNDTLMHLASHRLPFGGVGNSGMGAYHGKVTFDTFTHYKSVLKKSTLIDLPIRYRPYTEKKLKTIKKFLK